ncbi:YgzB family protein [Planomicrobium sp. CPCC 101079]|uniref:YgzB family protein n=1 Tax=Planomicrobium sp. CPCC 101079 TaxID=2599618 RepID=UPI0011B360C9|nr:YgzB family protein [Planomicrobium sp. CPCC 101079]TWT13422.1 hypothetical protein FQV28_01815 [Planomicrobium sp. CPCC 101079]
MKPYKNKINRIRTFALSLVFIGIVIMYVGIYFKNQPAVMVIFMLLGVLAVIGSTGVYAWIGLLSMKTIPVECPNCGKQTKMLGRVDMCMHCNEPLTMDPTLEGKEFSEEYNKKNS